MVRERAVGLMEWEGLGEGRMDFWCRWDRWNVQTRHLEIPRPSA